MRRRGCGCSFYRNGERWRLWSKGNEIFFFLKSPCKVSKHFFRSHSLSGTLMCQELRSLLVAAPLSVWFGATVCPAPLAPCSEFWIPSLSSHVYFIPWLMHSGPGLFLPYLLYPIICPCMPCKFLVLFSFVLHMCIYVCVCRGKRVNRYVCICMVAYRSQGTTLILTP